MPFQTLFSPPLPLGSAFFYPTGGTHMPLLGRKLTHPVKWIRSRNIHIFSHRSSLLCPPVEAAVVCLTLCSQGTFECKHCGSSSGFR